MEIEKNYFDEVKYEDRKISDFDVIDFLIKRSNMCDGVDEFRYIIKFSGFDGLYYLREDRNAYEGGRTFSGKIYKLKSGDTLVYLITKNVNPVTTLMMRMENECDVERASLDYYPECKEINELLNFIRMKEWKTIPKSEGE